MCFQIKKLAWNLEKILNCISYLYKTDIVFLLDLMYSTYRLFWWIARKCIIIHLLYLDISLKRWNVCSLVLIISGLFFFFFGVQMLSFNKFYCLISYKTGFIISINDIHIFCIIIFFFLLFYCYHKTIFSVKSSRWNGYLLSY